MTAEVETGSRSVQDLEDTAGIQAAEKAVEAVAEDPKVEADPEASDAGAVAAAPGEEAEEEQARPDRPGRP